MRNFRKICAAIALAATHMALLGGCVGPKYQAPLLNDVALQAATKELQSNAMDVQLARRSKLYDLAWPVLSENTAFCQETRFSTGIVMADPKYLAKLIGGLQDEQLADLGVEDGIRIVHIMKGSPAAMAGLSPGMKLTSVSGEAVATDAKLSKALKPISESLKETQQVTLGFEDQSYNLQGTEICDIAVKMSQSSILNAYAFRQQIVINGGLLARLDEDAVQFIIAHEVAHIAANHQGKTIRNLVSSGAVIYGPVLIALGNIGDTLKPLTGSDNPVKLSGKALAATAPFSAAFEAEADYLGLYMFARAGGNLSAARNAFDLFATESPASTWIKYTHPLTPNRVVATQAGILEIEAKQAAGEELIPNLVGQ